MAKKSIRLTHSDGTPWVEQVATIYGPFGIHKNHLGWSFVVTHIPTGACVKYGLDSEQQALRLARGLVRLGVNWNFRDPKRIPKRTREIVGRYIKERFKDGRLIG
jgi:hypothetical protein